MKSVYKVNKLTSVISVFSLAKVNDVHAANYSLEMMAFYKLNKEVHRISIDSSAQSLKLIYNYEILKNVKLVYEPLYLLIDNCGMVSLT